MRVCMEYTYMHRVKVHLSLFLGVPSSKILLIVLWIFVKLWEGEQWIIIYECNQNNTAAVTEETEVVVVKVPVENNQHDLYFSLKQIGLLHLFDTLETALSIDSHIPDH